MADSVPIPAMTMATAQPLKRHHLLLQDDARQQDRHHRIGGTGDDGELAVLHRKAGVDENVAQRIRHGEEEDQRPRAQRHARRLAHGEKEPAEDNRADDPPRQQRKRQPVAPDCLVGGEEGDGEEERRADRHEHCPP